MFKKIRDIISGSILRIIAILAMTMSAIFLHFFGEYLAEKRTFYILILLVNILEYTVLFCEFILVLVTIIAVTYKELYETLEDIGFKLDNWPKPK